MSGPTSTVWDAVASVCEDVTGLTHVYGAGVTTSVLYDTELVVPLQDDFVEAGLPAIVTMPAAGSPAQGYGWTVIDQDFLITAWCERQPVGDQAVILSDAWDALVASFAEHSKAYLHADTDDVRIQSALMTGWSGIEARQFAGAEGQPGRVYLAAPMTARVRFTRHITPQPA